MEKMSKLGSNEPHPHSPKATSVGTSLAVQCLDSPFSLRKAQVQPLVRELKLHKPQGTARRKKVTSAAEEPQGFADTIILQSGQSIWVNSSVLLPGPTAGALFLLVCLFKPDA